VRRRAVRVDMVASRAVVGPAACVGAAAVEGKGGSLSP
jgi:hypothetical protein